MKKNSLKKLLVLFGLLLAVLNVRADMVISKVFYSGTTQLGNSKNYTGGEEYIELYNNSSKEYDIAGMYICLIESESSTGAYLAKDRVNNEVKLKQVYQIPDDKPFVVAPWEAVVIAACAIDHGGQAQNGPNLSKADFEFGNMNGENPEVPNLKLVFSFNSNVKAVNITNGGDASLLLISKKNGSKLTAGDESTYVFANGKTSGNRYLPFNSYYAMDAVDILKTKLTDGVYRVDATRKRLGNSLDAGYVNAERSMLRDGYIAYRKTALNHDGAIMLYDTNNSSIDFAISDDIDVRQYDTKAAGVSEETVIIPESGYLPFSASKYFFAGKDLYITYMNVRSSAVTFNSYVGNSVIANNSVYVLVGKPGLHKIYYTEAQRSLATSGIDYWIDDDNEYYVNGQFVYTGGVAKYYPMKFVNEKGNVRFVRDMVDNNPKSMKIDLAREGRFYIKLNYLNENENTIPWGGITPDEVISAINVPVTSVHDDAVYTLQGIKVNTTHLPSGIYIRNGKKFVVR